MRLTAILPLVLVVLLSAPSCQLRPDAPASVTESVVDFSDPVPGDGADAPARAIGLAAILPSTFNGIDPSLLRWDDPREKKIDKRSPPIAVETRFLKIAPGLFARLPGDPGAPLRRLASDALERLLDEARDAGEVRQAPSVTAYSGQLCHSMVAQQFAYIQDLALGAKEDGSDGVELTPKIATLNTGIVVLARPAVVDGEIYIRDLGVEVVEKLGSRGCSAVVEHEDRSWDAVWEEPVVLVAKPDPELPEAIRLAEDETLVVPLRYEVKQACANVRALVAKDSLEETLKESGGPVTQECVVLVNVRRVAREE